jgi:putative tricarboxylic transport membrane protein
MPSSSTPTTVAHCPNRDGQVAPERKAPALAFWHREAYQISVAVGVIGAWVLYLTGTFTRPPPMLSPGLLPHQFPVLIGIFAISEMLVQSEKLSHVAERIAMTAVRLPTKEDYKKVWKAIARSCWIGTFIGILPAEGATVASLIGYNEAKRWPRNEEEFGKGAIEGVAGAEAANNAATGGAMVATLALGIPGSATTAVILGAFLVLGIGLGSQLFNEQREFVCAIFGSMLIANIMFFIMGLFGAKLFARVTLIPNTLLWPSVIVLSVVGAYSLDQSMLDVWIMIGSGLVGCVIRHFGFSVVPVAGPDSRRAGGGQPRAVAGDLRRPVAAVLHPPDRRDLLRPHAGRAVRTDRVSAAASPLVGGDRCR